MPWGRHPALGSVPPPWGRPPALGLVPPLGRPSAFGSAPGLGVGTPPRGQSPPLWVGPPPRGRPPPWGQSPLWVGPPPWGRLPALGSVPPFGSAPRLRVGFPGSGAAAEPSRGRPLTSPRQPPSLRGSRTARRCGARGGRHRPLVAISAPAGPRSPGRPSPQLLRVSRGLFRSRRADISCHSAIRHGLSSPSWCLGAD